MTHSLSASTRFLIAGLLLLALAFQLIFSGTHMMGQVYAHNGRISVDRQQWREAVWFYDHATQWFPHNHHWWFGKAQGHQGQFEVENTVVAFNQAHALAPNHISTIASLAYEVRDGGDPVLIRGLLDRGFALAPHFWNLHYTDGLLRMREGDLQGAREALSIAERNSTDIIALVEQSVAYNALATADLERAAYAVEKAVDRDATMPELWQLRGQILHSQDDPKSAADSYQRAIELYSARIESQPETAQGDSRLRGETQAYLGYAYAALENDDDALQNFAASTSQFVDLAFFGTAIDELRERSGNNAEAAWANVLSAAGRHDAALKIYTEVEQTNPASLTTLERYYWANSLRNKGNPVAALDQYRKMTELSWVEALAYADTLTEAGQRSAARFEYNRMLNLLRLNPQQQQIVQERIAALGQ